MTVGWKKRTRSRAAFLVVDWELGRRRGNGGDGKVDLECQRKQSIQNAERSRLRRCVHRWELSAGGNCER